MIVISNKYLGMIQYCDNCGALLKYNANDVAADNTITCPVCGEKQESKMGKND